MIKALKIKFISAIVGIISLLIISILIAVNLIMTSDIDKKISHSLKDIALSDGIKEPNLKPHKLKLEPLEKNYNFASFNFSIKLNHNNEIIETIYPKSLNIEDVDFDLTLNRILEDKRIQNHKDIYAKIGNWAYFLMNKPYGKIIVFQNIKNFKETKENLVYISILVYLISLVVIFIISYFLTEWIIKPVKENFDMQKQFIASASHELKTPLAIISTNLSVLKDEYNQIKEEIWLKNIDDEILNMNKLISELLVLSKTDILNNKKDTIDINISKIINNILLQYDVVCFEKNKVLSYDIAEDLYVKANKEEVETVLKILLDNAIKYSKENDIIEVKLEKIKNKINIVVFNTGVGIQEEFKDKIFERFFRADMSRNKEIEGYGLGLAIAKKIIDNNKWGIKVESEYGNWAKFIIEI